MAMRYLVLVWDEFEEKDNGGYHHLTLDFIPVDVLLSPRSKGKHFTAFTDETGEVQCVNAMFKSRSQGHVVTFDYDDVKGQSKHIYTGTMILDFDSPMRENLQRVHCRNTPYEDSSTSHSPGDINVSSSWVKMESKELNKEYIKKMIKRMGWDQSLYSSPDPVAITT